MNAAREVAACEAGHPVSRHWFKLLLLSFRANSEVVNRKHSGKSSVKLNCCSRDTFYLCSVSRAIPAVFEVSDVQWHLGRNFGSEHSFL